MSGKFGIFNPFHKWKKGDFPCDPIVNVVLNEWGTKADGRISISASLSTDSEIDYTIDRLQKNLESTRKNAKRVLKVHREKIRSSFER